MILITGAAGFIGSTLTEKVAHSGQRVRAVDSFLEESYSKKTKFLNIENFSRHKNIEFIDLDLRKEIPQSIFTDIDIVVNLAAMPGLQKSWEDFELYSSCNTKIVSNLLSLAKLNPIKNFIQISTSSVYGSNATGDESTFPDPVSPYGVTKLAGEQLVQMYNYNFGTPFTILRYFSVYGPRQRPDMAYHKLINAVLTDSSINIYGDGLQKRTNTYVDDCVDATLLAISRNATNQVFNVSGNEQITLNKAIAIIETHIGKKAKLIHSEAISGDQRTTQGNFQKAMDLLGYQPKSDFENGILNQIDWQKKHLKLV